MVWEILWVRDCVMVTEMVFDTVAKAVITVMVTEGVMVGVVKLEGVP